MQLAMEDYRWLVSDAAACWLDRAWEQFAQANPSVDSGGRLRGLAAELVMRLRKDLPSARAHLVAEQVELRWRAQTRFVDARRLFFTRQALEQATEPSLAEWKAERFADLAAWDLCCGVGGDLMALAGRASHVVGVERDPVVALLARANLDVLGLGQRAKVEVADATAVSLGPADAWHCDPDRRASGRRTIRPDHAQPPLETLWTLQQTHPAAAIKLACAARLPPAWQAPTEQHWLGSRGECRQLVLWCGPLARWPGRRAATVVEQGQPIRTVVEDLSEPPLWVEQPQTYLFELHPALRAAGLGPTLARQHALACLSDTGRFLTGTRAVHDPACTAYELLDVLPWDRKKVRAYCRQHRIGRVEIKAAGSGSDPQRLARELAGRGEAAATLLVVRLAGRWQAVVARRSSPPEGGTDDAPRRE